MDKSTGKGQSSATAKYYTLIDMDLEEAIWMYPNHIHAAHILLWTKDHSRGQTFGLMQIRSDGRIGFPGGKNDEPRVDANEIVKALYRELTEEIAFRPDSAQITIKDHLFSRLSKSNKVLHFFAKEIPLQTFEAIERSYPNARDFCKETLGLVRVPLRALTASSDPSGSSRAKTRTFFKRFAKPEFHGIAKQQMLDAFDKLDLLDEQDMAYVNEVMNK